MSGGDPASKPVNLLRRMGYDTVVLSTSLLRYGSETVDDYATIPEDYLDRIRFLDCMEVMDNA